MQVRTFTARDSKLEEALGKLDKEVGKFLDESIKGSFKTDRGVAYSNPAYRKFLGMGNQIIFREDNGYVVCMPICYQETEQTLRPDELI